MSSVEPAPEPQPQNGWFGNLLAWFSSHKLILEFLKFGGGILFGVGSTMLTFYTFVESRIDKVVNEKLDPYDRLTTGMAYSRSEMYDDAAKEFHWGIEEAEKSKARKELIDLLYDQLLNAMANAYDTSKYTGWFNQVKVHLENSPNLGETAYRTNDLGWYYLHSGNTMEARAKLGRAEQLFRQRQDKRGSSDPLRGLVWVAIAEGKIDEAIESAKLVVDRNPGEYTLHVFLKDSKNCRNELWFALQFEPFYKEIGVNVQKFELALEKCLAEPKSNPKQK